MPPFMVTTGVGWGDVISLPNWLSGFSKLNAGTWICCRNWDESIAKRF